MCNNCDPLHTAVAELLGDRPFVLSLLETVQPIGDGQAESAVRTLVHRMEPLQVLVVLNAFSATMLGEVGRERYEDHLAEHFREQLNGDGPSGVGIPLGEWVNNARRAAAERHAGVQGVLDDVLGDTPAPTDEDGDRG